VTTDNESSLR